MNVMARSKERCLCKGDWHAAFKNVNRTAYWLQDCFLLQSVWLP